MSDVSQWCDVWLLPPPLSCLDCPSLAGVRGISGPRVTALCAPSPGQCRHPSPSQLACHMSSLEMCEEIVLLDVCTLNQNINQLTYSVMNARRKQHRSSEKVNQNKIMKICFSGLVTSHDTNDQTLCVLVVTQWFWNKYLAFKMAISIKLMTAKPRGSKKLQDRPDGRVRRWVSGMVECSNRN